MNNLTALAKNIDRFFHLSTQTGYRKMTISWGSAQTNNRASSRSYKKQSGGPVQQQALLEVCILVGPCRAINVHSSESSEKGIDDDCWRLPKDGTLPNRALGDVEIRFNGGFEIDDSICSGWLSAALEEK